MMAMSILPMLPLLHLLPLPHARRTIQPNLARLQDRHGRRERHLVEKTAYLSHFPHDAHHNDDMTIPIHLILLQGIIQWHSTLDSAAMQEGDRSVFRYNPNRMDYARDIAEDRQQDVDPKLLANPYLQEHP